jgi:NADPH:quinone reductase-like Zn-dependent oxidoreductase
MNKDDISAVGAARRLSQPKKRSRQAAKPGTEAKKTTMKAAAIDKFGPPSVLKLHLLPMPKPGAGEVLIALRAAGIGVWDGDIRGGWWPQGRPRFPLVLGSDGAGIVVAKGVRVRRFRGGDRVWAYEFINPKGGFYAEYVAVNAEHVGRLPRRLDFLHAGASAVTGLTALQGIDDHLRVRKGETVLIFVASGAVGTLAVQFAKRRGAKVLGSASASEATKLVRSLGATGVFDPRSKNAVEQLKALAPDGINAVLALAGGDMLERCLDLVRAGGRVAHPNGVEPKPKKRKNVRVLAYDAAGGRREFERLDRAVEEARLRVPVAAIYPLAQAAKAHQRLEKGHVLGRIVLEIK